MSKQAKLLSHLQSGNEVTVRQIAGVFGIAHPASAIRNLREQGYCIYTNSGKLSTGEVTTKYKLGKASKRMIRTINAIYGATAFTARRVKG